MSRYSLEKWNEHLPTTPGALIMRKLLGRFINFTFVLMFWFRNLLGFVMMQLLMHSCDAAYIFDQNQAAKAYEIIWHFYLTNLQKYLCWRIIASDVNEHAKNKKFSKNWKLLNFLKFLESTLQIFSPFDFVIIFFRVKISRFSLSGMWKWWSSGVAKSSSCFPSSSLHVFNIKRFFSFSICAVRSDFYENILFSLIKNEKKDENCQTLRRNLWKSPRQMLTNVTIHSKLFGSRSWSSRRKFLPSILAWIINFLFTLRRTYCVIWVVVIFVCVTISLVDLITSWINWGMKYYTPETVV